MPGDLPWTTVWITGASTGIGRAIAERLADAGAKVAVSARSAEKLESLAALYPGVAAYPLDVTDAAAVQDTCRKIEGEMGPIDLVLFAAGTYAPVSLDRVDAHDFDAAMRVNYMGVVNGLSAILPRMRARRRGHVAWIASVAGYRGLPKAASYGPTKAALINLAESLKPDLERDGITTSIVNPGFVRTPLTAQNDFEMPFLIEPEDAAGRTIAGLAAGRFEIAFPRRFVAILKLARVLPYTLYFSLVRRFVMRD